MSNDKVIDKIRKLLAMANCAASPKEAIVAAKMARALMDKHQIKESDIGEKTVFGTSSSSNSKVRWPVWLQTIAVYVAKWNDCLCKKAFVDDGKSRAMKFQGFEADAIIALNTYEYLIEAVERLCKRGGYKGRVGFNYRLGAAVELKRRIGEEIKKRKVDLKGVTGTDLVVIKKELVEEHFGSSTYKECHISSSCDDQVEAWKKGKSDASNIGLDVQVEDKTQRRYIC